MMTSFFLDFQIKKDSGTFGMTILGAVMNAKSGTLLTQQVLPVLQKLPVQAGEVVSKLSVMIHSAPQNVYSALMNPKSIFRSINKHIKKLLQM